MAQLKTLFVITIATARMIFPGTPAMQALEGEAAMSHAARSVTLDLTSERKADARSKAECAVPDGLKVGRSVSLRIDLSAPEEPAAAPADKPEASSIPKFTIKRYWGCGDAVPEGQPKVSASTDIPAGTGAAQDPTTSWMLTGSNAFWPFDEQKPIAADASAVGTYTLSTNYCGGSTVTLDADQDFLAPIDISDLGKNIDLDKPIKVSWKSVPNAVAYVLNAYGGNSSETVTWTSSANPDAAAEFEYQALTKEALDSSVRKNILLPAQTTSCTIPAGIFKGCASAMLTIIALGRDKVQEKDGIRTEVVIRSNASLPLYSTPYISPMELEEQSKPHVVDEDEGT